MVKKKAGVEGGRRKRRSGGLGCSKEKENAGLFEPGVFRISGCEMQRVA
jgi:hypothetical protein